MTSIDLKSAALESVPPEGVSDAWKVLWHVARGGDESWHHAHEIAQAMPGKLGAWLHAHLHMREGDKANARYWYAMAERPAKGLIDPEGEFAELVEFLETTGA